MVSVDDFMESSYTFLYQAMGVNMAIAKALFDKTGSDDLRFVAIYSPIPYKYYDKLFKADINDFVIQVNIELITQKKSIAGLIQILIGRAGMDYKVNPNESEDLHLICNLINDNLTNTDWVDKESLQREYVEKLPMFEPSMKKSVADTGYTILMLSNLNFTE